MRRTLQRLSPLILLSLLLTGCSSVGSKAASASVIYGVAAVLSLALLVLYWCIAKKKDPWYLLLFSSIMVVNIGYFALAISGDVGEALLANRVSYLGSVFLPLSMLMIIVGATHVRIPKWLPSALLGLAVVMFLIAASPGYLPIYYKDVSFAVVNGAATLIKEYGPLHALYLVYLLGYFGSMITVIVHATLLPEEVLKAFEEATGRGCLCNLPYSGTDVIRDYGQEHLDTGKWIIYTSADSVFQVAAHEELVSLDELYDACHKAREILRGKHGVGRVIARPFVGDAVNGFKRTSNRHDYSLEPPARTLLDAIKEAGLASIGVGKIYDIFAGIGTTEHVYNTSNANGMEHTDHYADQDFEGLCFVNLVDFDMVFGHRRNIDGYANALTEFDTWLGGFLPKLREDDILMITADHGCDPAYTATTDHTREYVPLIVAGPKVKPVNLGTRLGFCDIAATIAEMLNVELDTEGKSFASEVVLSAEV